MNGRVGERGSATIWVIVGIALVVAVTAAVAAAGAAVGARHRAAGAADAAALAAALTVVDGAVAACAAARRFAQRNGVALQRCVVDGAVVTVTTRLPLSGPLQWFGAATGMARAGPDPEREIWSNLPVTPTSPDFSRSGLRISRRVVP